MKIRESELRNIIQESVKKVLNEAINGGWEVETDEARDAYDFAVEKMGKETIDNAIIMALSDDALAQCLAYIFRMYEFREWDAYKAEQEEGEEEELEELY